MLSKALLISDSPELRETVQILLADRFRVQFASAESPPERVDADVSLVLVEAAAMRSAALPQGIPALLWIGAAPAAAPPAPRQLELPAHFEALSLRDAAGDLLEPQSRAVPGLSPSTLDYPYLPKEMVPVAARAAASPLPLLISGEAGTGKERLARALHAQRGGAYLLSAGAADLRERRLDLPPAGLPAGSEVTLLLAAADEIDPRGQSFLVEILEGRAIADPAGRLLPLRVVAIATCPAEELLRQGRLGRELFYRLNVLSLHVPPLRQRAADIPDLVRAVSQGLCASLGMAPVSFTAAGLERLSRYLWFGNLAELEAVIARSIAFAPDSTLDTEDLLFGYGPVVRRLAPQKTAAEVRARPTAPPPANGATVDLIINELAHEFKNPLVTIKTFTQQLDQVRPGDDVEMARLTGEAIERIDGALENLVQFTRFEEPNRQPTPTSALVGTALEALDSVLAEKQIAVEVEAAAGEVLVDPGQLSYALRNLLQSIVRDLSTGDFLSVRAPSPGTLTIEYPAAARSIAHKLAALVTTHGDSSRALPLGFAFAKTLVERNGGQLSVETATSPARVRIELPGVAEGVEGDGKTENLSR